MFDATSTAITPPKRASTRRLFAGVDGRTSHGRRFRDLARSIAAAVEDAGLSDTRLSLVRCAAMMLTESETLPALLEQKLTA